MTKTYTATILYKEENENEAKKYTISVPEDQTILLAAEAAGLMLPTSCGAGVCTTCAALIIKGEVDQSGGMGVSPDLQKEGYALLCVAYPRSDLEIEAQQEDYVYSCQFKSA
ncbi:MAG: 2Fe-2S iron-sulfur cluster-binding protein [Microcystaceae cyanobacterium]